MTASEPAALAASITMGGSFHWNLYRIAIRGMNLNPLGDVFFSSCRISKVPNPLPKLCLAKIRYRGELAPGGLRIILVVAMTSWFGWLPIAVGNDGIMGVSEKKQVDILFFLQ
jgi:hypothetical protein